MSKLTVRLVVFFVFAAAAAGQNPKLVWLTPHPSWVWPDGRTGSVDYTSLFSPNAPWTNAASHIQIFKIYNVFFSNLPGTPTDTDMRQLIADLNRRGIALALEWGPLFSNACGKGVEGFNGDVALGIAQKIQAFGGNLQYIAFDEPFYDANIYDGPNKCLWTAQQIAANAAQNVAQIRSVFPNVIVGNIEPAPPPGTPDWVKRYSDFLDAWKAVTGSHFAFFHLDVNYPAFPNWVSDVEPFRQALASRGIPMGIIYNGISQKSDSGWIRAAESHFIDYEVFGGIVPDHAIIQSWETYPTHVLPESDPNTLTYLVNRYSRTRTSISLASTATQAFGRLSNRNGNPISSAAVDVAIQAVAGPGFLSTYTLTGTVPDSSTKVTQALLQICVNKCGSQGTNDMNLYSFRYTDSAANFSQDFSNGFSGWLLEGLRTATVQLASDSNGPSVLIQATPSQETFVNSASFPVINGSAFTLTINARISPGSVNSGYFALIFLVDGKETSRMTLPFSASTAKLASTLTTADGSYTASLPVQIAGSSKLQAYYAGSDTLWPAAATAPVDSVSLGNTRLIVSSPAAAVIGTPLNFTVTALDSTGNVAAGYNGTVRFSSTDSSATLPANATLSGGTGAFSATLRTAGTQTITATDTAASSLTANSAAISVTANGQPAAVGVSPAGGNSAAQSMTFTFSHPQGFQTLGVVNILINNALDGRTACYLAYSRPASVLYLVSDNGGALLPGALLTSAGSTSNSQCAVSWGNTAVSGSGTTLTLSLDLAFKSSFAGNRIVFLAARDVADNNSGWQPMGTWQVPGTAAAPLSVSGITPVNGSGLRPTTFSFTFNDTRGYQDLGVQNILVNNALDGRHACYLAYARQINVLYLGL